MSDRSREPAASWLDVALLPGMDDAIFARARAAFARPAAYFAASPERLASATRITPARAAALLGPDALAGAARALETARSEARRLIGPDDAAYPTLLREMYEPPRFLAVDGSLDDPPEKRVAIVGSRTTDRRARDAAADIAGALAARGYCVVSGLARGVDSAAHEGALAGGGRTIAVLGTGLDIVYPEENVALARRIARQGALVSSFPPGARPHRHHFPIRNKTIAGLCRAVLVVQASEKSGALITARYALHANREVFAMPGPVGDPRYVGSNRLLRDGAHLCLDLGDLVGELEGVAAALAIWTAAESGRAGGSGATDGALPLTGDEQAVLDHLASDPTHVDEIARDLDLPPGALLSLLLTMEIKGAVRALPGACYARRARLGS